MNLTDCIHQGKAKTLALKLQPPRHAQFAIARIKSACKAQGLAELRIRGKGDFVDVEFCRPTPGTTGTMGGGAGYNRRVPNNLTQQVRVILTHRHQRNQVTMLEAAALLAVKERLARAVLKDMIDKGLLEKRGSARQIFYEKVDV